MTLKQVASVVSRQWPKDGPQEPPTSKRGRVMLSFMPL
jgi:hypothetical protein